MNSQKIFLMVLGDGQIVMNNYQLDSYQLQHEALLTIESTHDQDKFAVTKDRYDISRGYTRDHAGVLAMAKEYQSRLRRVVANCEIIQFGAPGSCVRLPNGKFLYSGPFDSDIDVVEAIQDLGCQIVKIEPTV